MTEQWFALVGHDVPLTQGDIIVDCPLLKWKSPKNEVEPPDSVAQGESVDRLFRHAAGIRADVVVMTQACDLEHGKVSDVVLCPCLPLSKYKSLWETAERARNQNPTAKAWKRFCEEITDGSIWNLFMMDSVPEGELSSEHRIVDFHSVNTVPRAFLEGLLAERGIKRLRLLPPYREHLSQFLREVLYAGGLARKCQTGLVDVAVGELADGIPLRAVADQLDETLLCFNLLQEELGLPAGQEPRYGRLLGEDPGNRQAPR
jgi:hypothetical protein